MDKKDKEPKVYKCLSCNRELTPTDVIDKGKDKVVSTQNGRPVIKNNTKIRCPCGGRIIRKIKPKSSVRKIKCR